MLLLGCLRPSGSFCRSPLLQQHPLVLLTLLLSLLLIFLPVSRLQAGDMCRV